MAAAALWKAQTPHLCDVLYENDSSAARHFESKEDVGRAQNRALLRYVTRPLLTPFPPLFALQRDATGESLWFGEGAGRRAAQRGPFAPNANGAPVRRHYLPGSNHYSLATV